MDDGSKEAIAKAAQMRMRQAIINECADVVRRHRPDASFNDSSAGYMERHALLKNVENDIRKLGGNFDEYAMD